MANNRYTISKGNLKEQKPGSWWRALQGRVFIRCPMCKMSSRMGTGPEGHVVNDRGEVYPSLDCVATKGCSFHEHVILEGWPGADSE